jgi:hypothetical protein
MKLKTCIAAAAFCAPLLPIALPVQAETLALLIAAGEYANNPDLQAPRNDAHDVLAFLTDRGVDRQNIAMLADDTPGAETATRQNILNALTRLAASAQAGDMVFLYLSGHGVQVADEDGDEADRRDEAFVPVDAPQSGFSADNVVIDDRIREALDTIRDKGADVWVVMDSCHSGTGIRGDHNGILAKGLRDDEAAGAGRIASSETMLDDHATVSGADRGDIVAFFAAKPFEAAYEGGDAEDTTTFRSLFTNVLLEKLRRYPQRTYGEIIELVRLHLADNRARQTPQAEGTMLDRPIFGTPASTDGIGNVAWWPVENGKHVNAGWISNLERGSILALYKSVTLDGEPAYAKVRSVGAVRSGISFCDFDKTAEDVCKSTAAPQNAAEYKYARLELPGMEQHIRLKVDARDAGSPDARHLITSLAGKLENNDWEGYGLDVAISQSTFDYQLVARGDRIYIVGDVVDADADLDGRYPFVVSGSDNFIHELSSKLRDMWFIRRLAEYAKDLKRESFDLSWINLDVEHAPSSIDETDWETIAALPERGLKGRDLFNTYRSEICGDKTSTSFEPTGYGANLTDCDVVRISAANTSRHYVRLYIFHYGSDGCLRQFYPTAKENFDPRLAPANTAMGGSTEIPKLSKILIGTRMPERSLGREGLIAIAVKEESGQTQPPLRSFSTCVSHRSAGAKDLFPVAFKEFFGTDGTRSARPVQDWDLDTVSIWHIEWNLEEYSTLAGRKK